MNIKNFIKIPGFEDYLVNSYGTIVSVKVHKNNPCGKPHVIRPYEDRSGYMVVSLRDSSGKRKNIFVHTAVALAFIPNPQNYKYINHKDRNPKNNKVNNLEWCSLEYNNRYSFAHGCEQRGCLCRLIYNGKIIGEFPSLASAARYAVKNFGCNYNKLLNFLKDGNIQLERLEQKIHTYKVYKGDVLIFTSRYLKDCAKYVKEHYGKSLSHKKMYSTTEKILIIKDDSTDINAFWKSKEKKQVLRLCQWDVYLNHRYLKTVVGLNEAVAFILSIDKSASERSIRRYHKWNNFYLIKKDIVYRLAD